ncbi:MAG: energy transducer TonB [Pyrinomonadaceae bacterium]
MNRLISLRMAKRADAVRAVVICLAVATAFLGIDSRFATAATEAWSKYTGKDEQFSVRMPREPWLYFNLITSESGKRIPERIYSTYSNGSVYLVVSYDRNSLKDTFENFKLHHCTQAEITPIKDKTLSGFAGKEYSLKFGDVVGIVDVYATKKRGYAVATVQAIDNGPLRDYFLSTFSLSGADESMSNSPPQITTLPQSDSTEIATGGKQVTRKPIVVSKPEPWYTDDARNAGITGTVVLRVVFASSGEITNMHVVRGLSKGLTEQAIEAARHLTFIPATKDGRFVSYWMELQYNFGLY